MECRLDVLYVPSEWIAVCAGFGHASAQLRTWVTHSALPLCYASGNIANASTSALTITITLGALALEVWVLQLPASFALSIGLTPYAIIVSGVISPPSAIACRYDCHVCLN